MLCGRSQNHSRKPWRLIQTNTQSKYFIRKFEDHSARRLFERTISAQLHFIAFVAAIIGLGVFIASPSIRGVNLFACCVFIVAGASTMLISAVYHFISDGYKISDPLMASLENLDHFSIYVMIAGSYTPFLLAVVHPPWRERLITGIWVIAFVGILYTALKPRLPRWMQTRAISTSVFLAMGWLMVVRIQEIWQQIPASAFSFLVAGGLFYSVGAVIYVIKKPDPIPGIFGFHEIWHVAVAGGFTCHYFLILSLFT